MHGDDAAFDTWVQALASRQHQAVLMALLSGFAGCLFKLVCSLESEVQAAKQNPDANWSPQINQLMVGQPQFKPKSKDGKQLKLPGTGHQVIVGVSSCSSLILSGMSGPQGKVEDEDSLEAGLCCKPVLKLQ